VNFEKELFNKPHSIEIPFGAVSILSKISLDVFSSQENKTSAYAFRLGEIPSTHRITSKKNRTVVFITKKDLARISRSSTPLNPTP
jgi:hypothetical protein